MKTLTFVAPLKSWTLPFEAFREVILVQAMQIHASVHNIWPNFWSHSDDSGRQSFIEEHWDGKFPLSDEQIRVGFEKYQVDALAVKDLLLGEELKVAWTSALRNLRNLHSLRFANVSCSDFFDQNRPVQPDCTIRPHHHDSAHREETCEKAAEAIGEALFTAGLACLAQAHVKPRSLDVACAMTGQFGCDTLLDLEKLDLTQLQTFEFRPRIHSGGNNLDAFGGTDAVAERAADFVAVILKKSRDSLETFRYEDYCPMRWPGAEVVPLSRLRVLSLGSGQIWSQNLSPWMAEMPSLDEFSLEGSMLCDDREYGWLGIFDVIRNHPKPMHIAFERIVAKDAAEVSLDFYTDDYEGIVDISQDLNGNLDIYESLELYLSGKIEFNESMRLWFD